MQGKDLLVLFITEILFSVQRKGGNMKIAIDIPDTSLCAAINLVYKNESNVLMIATHTADTKELRSGEVIIMPSKEKEET